MLQPFAVAVSQGWVEVN